MSIFAFSMLNKMEVKYKVKDWVEDLQRGGRIAFTLTEVMDYFSTYKSETIRRALTRLASKGKIISVWNGFYVIIPIEYQAKKTVPVIFYIDHLMKYLNRDYYIALLNAAAIYGAAHQRPQEFTVVTTPPSLRDSSKNGIKINFISKSTIPEQFTEQQKTPTGYVKISSAALTATDLVQYEKEVGGLNRAATILSELAERLDFKQLPASFFEYVPTPVIQRLGYLLDLELEYTSLADELLTKVNQYGHSFRKTPLKNRKSIAGCNTNEKWNVIINEQIEIDE